MRTVVHVGLGRASSTYMQDVVLPGLSGISVPFADAEGQKLLGTVGQQDQLEFDEAGTAAEVSRRMAEVAGRHPVTVVSSEGLSVPGGCDRRVLVQRVKRLFPDGEILFVMRRQDDLIRSYYGGAVNLGVNNFGMRRFPDINTWLELAPMFAPVRFVHKLHPLQAAAYHHLLREYIDVFGPERVHIVLFEAFKNDKPAYAAALGRIYERPEQEVFELLHHEPKRQIIVGGKVKHKISLSPLQRQRGGLFFNRYIQRLMREIVPRLRPRLRTGFDEKWTRRMAEAYGEANRRLAREFDLPLARHGYPGCEVGAGQSDAAAPVAAQAGD